MTTATGRAGWGGRSWGRAALLAALHLGLFFFVFFLSLSNIDDDPVGLVSRVARPFFWVLGLPLWPIGLWLEDAVFTGRGMPDALEWGLVLGNSLLWGITLEATLRRRPAQV